MISQAPLLFLCPRLVYPSGTKELMNRRIFVYKFFCLYRCTTHQKLLRLSLPNLSGQWFFLGCAFILNLVVDIDVDNHCRYIYKLTDMSLKCATYISCILLQISRSFQKKTCDCPGWSYKARSPLNKEKSCLI